MAERKTALTTAIKSLPASPEDNYFSSLTLRNFYGDYTLKPGTRIMTDIPNDDDAHKLFKDDDRLEELAKKYNIPHIGSGSYGGDRKKQPFIEISVGMGEPTTNWAPYVLERGAITALTMAVAPNRQPFLLDVGCGSGFTSKLIAVDSKLKVLGIDPYLSAYDKLPETPGDVTLREADIFDVIGELGPSRTPEDLAKLTGILSTIRGSFQGKEDLYYWGMQHGFRSGYQNFDQEVAELQELGGKYSAESPVDVVLCSFMNTGTDLTPAIRDGIRPKAIVYIKPTNDLCGVGDYYDGLPNSIPTGDENKVVSFNPGKNYKTLARWQTFWEDDWGRELYDQSIASERAEVIIQVRKDVELTLPQDLNLKSYKWDDEIEDIILRQKKRLKETRRILKEKYPGEDIYLSPHNFFMGLGARLTRLASEPKTRKFVPGI